MESLLLQYFADAGENPAGICGFIQRCPLRHQYGKTAEGAPRFDCGIRFDGGAAAGTAGCRIPVLLFASGFRGLAQPAENTGPVFEQGGAGGELD
ncbi:hypothetical protein D3C75_860220 [compost metagenome]